METKGNNGYACNQNNLPSYKLDVGNFHGAQRSLTPQELSRAGPEAQDGPQLLDILGSAAGCGSGDLVRPLTCETQTIHAVL